jgi:Uma2 family endonuclease
MGVPQTNPWTQDDFFAWATAHEGRYEFDGIQPVAMTGGTIAHDTIVTNISFAGNRRLLGKGCRVRGPNAGVATVGNVVRYADAVITCSKQHSDAHTLTDPQVVVELISPGSERVDRIVKLREYAAVPSILRYVIVESTTIGLTVHERTQPGEIWRSTSLENLSDTLHIPEVGIEFSVDEIYLEVTFASKEEA